MLPAKKSFVSGLQPLADPGLLVVCLLALLDEWLPAGPVLEVGCGPGELALALAERGLQVPGVDLAGAAIEHARAKADAAGLEDKAALQMGDELRALLRPSAAGGCWRCARIFCKPARRWGMGRHGRGASRER